MALFAPANGRGDTPPLRVPAKWLLTVAKMQYRGSSAYYIFCD